MQVEEGVQELKDTMEGAAQELKHNVEETQPIGGIRAWVRHL